MKPKSQQTRPIIVAIKLDTAAVLLGTTFFIVSMAHSDPGASNGLLTHPDRYSALAEVKGKVTSLGDHGLTIADANQTVTLSLKKDSEIKDGDGHALALSNLKVGDPVLAYYNTEEKTVVEIDLEPTVAAAVLGAPLDEHR